MSLSHSSTSPSTRLAWIGGAASTIISLAYLVRRLKKDPAFIQQSFDLYVFDPQGLNEGPAYRNRNSGFVLNQPAGEEMDPFHNAGPDLPQSFLKWLNSPLHQKTQDTVYTNKSFVSRGTYGDYLLYIRDWVKEQIAAHPTLQLHEIKDQVQNITALTPANDALESYQIQTRNRDAFHVDGFTLATGHTYNPKIEHPQYLPAYVSHDFETRLKALSQTTEPKTIVGSGASMADVICALEEMGSKGQYRVISPYGNTRWPYNPEAPVPDPDKVQAFITSFLDDPQTYRDASGSLRRLINVAQRQDIAPQYIVSACLSHPGVENNEELLKVAKAFYGNPLSPERFALLEKLDHEGRLTHIRDRIEKIDTQDGRLRLNFAGQSSETISGHLIDCAVINRGIVNAEGHIAPPLIASLIDQGIISASREKPGALDINPAAGKLIYAIGPVTRGDKNGIQTFCKDYSRAPDDLLDQVKNRQQTFVVQAAAGATRFTNFFINPHPQP